MQRLRDLSRCVETVFSEMSETFSAYQQKRGLTCRVGCGECCSQPTVEATVLEMLPLALHLFDEGKAEQTLAQLEAQTEPQSCIIYQSSTTDGKQGQCGAYAYRPSVCRFFGAAGYRDKSGAPSLSICKIIKADLPHKYQETLIAIESEPPPMMLAASEKVNELDYELGKVHLPINEALQEALEKVLFNAWCESFKKEPDTVK